MEFFNFSHILWRWEKRLLLEVSQASGLLDEEKHEEEAEQTACWKEPKNAADVHKVLHWLKSHKQNKHENELHCDAQSRRLVWSYFGHIDPPDRALGQLVHDRKDADWDEREEVLIQHQAEAHNEQNQPHEKLAIHEQSLSAKQFNRQKASKAARKTACCQNDRALNWAKWNSVFWLFVDLLDQQGCQYHNRGYSRVLVEELNNHADNGDPSILLSKHNLAVVLFAIFFILDKSRTPSNG